MAWQVGLPSSLGWPRAALRDCPWRLCINLERTEEGWIWALRVDVSTQTQNVNQAVVASRSLKIWSAHSFINLECAKQCGKMDLSFQVGCSLNLASSCVTRLG